MSREKLTIEPVRDALHISHNLRINSSTEFTVNVIRKQNLFKPILFGVAVWLLQVTPAAADVETAVADLKACINNNIANEKAKANPHVDGLLQSCNAEYQALRRELHDGVREQADDHVRSDLRNLLRGS